MKLMHLSDLHFGLHREELIEPFLHELEKIKPEVLIISGDLTQRAKEEQFKAFMEFAKKLTGVVLIVPGNHDIPLYPSQFFMRMLYPFQRYKDYVNSELHVHFENEHIRVLGVNSVNPYRVTKGRLSRATMEQIHDYFSPSFSGINILFFHHNFDRLEGAHKPLENYEEFICYLKTSPIHIVCAGHSHYANVNLIEKNNHQSCLFLHAGSLLSRRRKDGFNSYFTIELHNPNCQVDWHIYQNNEFIVQQHYSFDLSLYVNK